MKHLILDIGGVLVYPRLGEWHLPYRAAEILGPERAKDLQTERFAAAWKRCLGWLREDRVVMDVETERQMRRGFVLDLDRWMGWHMTDDEISAMTDDFTDDPDRYGFFDDVGEWLEKWSTRYAISALSDAMPSAIALLKEGGIYPYFREVLISTHVGTTKPGERMYRTLLDRLGADPGECVFADDRRVNIDGALRLGLRAVQMDRPEFPAEDPWDGPVAHSFAELDQILREGAYA